MSTSTSDLGSLLSMVSSERVRSANAQQTARELHVRPATEVARRSSSSDQSNAEPKQDVQTYRQELNAALERVSRLDHRLSFKVDEDSGKSVVVVRDARTSEVLKQFPSEEMLNVARRLEEHLSKQSSMTGVLHADEA